MSRDCSPNGWVKGRGGTKLWAVRAAEEECQPAPRRLTVEKDSP